MTRKTGWLALILTLVFFALILRSCASPEKFSSPQDVTEALVVTTPNQEQSATEEPNAEQETPVKPDEDSSKLGEQGTVFAIVRVAAKGAKLEHRVKKPTLTYRESRVGRARFKLQDPSNDRVLATGRCPWPRLCKCPLKKDHRIGCVPTRHEAVVRLKLPLLGRDALVRIETLKSGLWKEAGRFKIEK